MNPFSALYLIPVNISDAPLEATLPASVLSVAPKLRFFIVENVRTARRFLRRCDPQADISAMTFFELNSHTDPTTIPSMLEPLRRGEPMGLMSEAGCPAVADPGAQAVAIAHREGLRVVPMAGPSSIVMALMASGFNGQGFSFVGYLPIDKAESTHRIKELEARARREDSTQIFIETPYRNEKMLGQLLSTLRPDTRLCVATAITDPEHECILSMPVSKWKSRGASVAKLPTIFLIYRP